MPPDDRQAQAPTIEDADPVDWVALRAACTIEAIFTELYERVRIDVDSAGKALGDKGSFNLSGNAEQGYFTVKRPAAGAAAEPAVTFNRRSDEIEIDRIGGERLMVTRTWDQEKTRCILHVGGQPMPLWQISQMALYDAFFD